MREINELDNLSRCGEKGGTYELHGPSSATAHATTRGATISSLGVLDRLVNGNNQTGGFTCSSERVNFHYARLPHTCLEVVRDVLLGDVNTIPLVTWT